MPANLSYAERAEMMSLFFFFFFFCWRTGEKSRGHHTRLKPDPERGQKAHTYCDSRNLKRRKTDSRERTAVLPGCVSRFVPSFCSLDSFEYWPRQQTGIWIIHGHTKANGLFAFASFGSVTCFMFIHRFETKRTDVDCFLKGICWRKSHFCSQCHTEHGECIVVLFCLKEAVASPGAAFSPDLRDRWVISFSPRCYHLISYSPTLLPTCLMYNLALRP